MEDRSGNAGDGPSDADSRARTPDDSRSPDGDDRARTGDGRTRPGDDHLRYGRWDGAAAVGVGVATLLALVPPVWPALAVGAGAFAVAAPLLVLARGRRRRYGTAGSAYVLALGLVLWLAAALGRPLPAVAEGSPHVALATLGGASALAVLARLAVARFLEAGFRRLVRGGLRSKLVAVRTAAKLLGSFRTVVALLGRFTRVAAVALLAVGLVALLGLVAFALNALGVGRPVPWLGGTVDVVLLVFVAVTLVGFFALDAAESTWVATREGVDQGRSVVRRVRDHRRDDGSE